ncbi:serine hydrolase domain-containing protein [Haloferula sp. BvORR071]|uniref:serine hydrolase n=1 Tax=Haloferula sp. BvORR071 TaxID=1396141 RepID=UPI000554D984|nr:serine hydrolase domain-containing protein [Haloferula sp. BvORR071]
MMDRRRFLYSLVAACGGCATSGSSSGAGGWSSAELRRADAIAKGNGAKGWAAWHGHRELVSWQTHERGPSLSLTKVLGALAATKAAGEGWLSDSERVSATIPEWRGDARKSRITVLMLLQQTAGLEAGVASLYRNPADKGRNALLLSVVDEPGSLFRYGPACWEVLGELLQRKLSSRGETLEKFLHRAVMRPVGLSSPNWRSDKKGRFFLSTGAEMSVEELGRLGRTLGKLLSGESTDGFDPEIFARMTRTSAANPIFGGGIWRNANARKAGAYPVEIEDVLDPPRGGGFWAGACMSLRQPASMVALVGSSGKRVFIWPGENRVVARLGRSSAWKDGPFLGTLS